MIAKLLDLNFRSLTAYFLSYRIVRNITTAARAEENYHKQPAPGQVDRCVWRLYFSNDRVPGRK
jgi:hypothetical protein